MTFKSKWFDKHDELTDWVNENKHIKVVTVLHRSSYLKLNWGVFYWERRLFFAKKNN